jgi:hypothetical protein
MTQYCELGSSNAADAILGAINYLGTVIDKDPKLEGVKTCIGSLRILAAIGGECL